MMATFDFSGTLIKESEEDEAKKLGLHEELDFYKGACSCVLKAKTPEEAIDILEGVQSQLILMGKEMNISEQQMKWDYTFNPALKEDVKAAKNNGGIVVASFMPSRVIRKFMKKHVKKNYKVYGGLTPKEKMNYVKGDVYIDDVCSFGMAYAAHQNGGRVIVVRNGSKFNDMLFELLDKFKISYETRE